MNAASAAHQLGDSMSRVSGILRKSPALAVAVLALFFALGSGAGYAASQGSNAPVWHRLKLDQGWKGQLSYTAVNGVVYLKGYVTAIGADHYRNTMIAQVPPADSNKGIMFLPAVFGRTTGPFVKYDGAVDVADGFLFPIEPPGHTVQTVWLSGLSYLLDQG
jgi:hypothetical protein